MPPDLTDLLHAAAPDPTRPLDARALVRRGRRRAAAVPAMAAITGVVAVTAVLAVGLPLGPDRLDPAPAPGAAPTASADATAPEVPLGSGACPSVLEGEADGEPIGSDHAAEIVVVCSSDMREFAGEGAWQVVVERRSREIAAETVRLLSQPDEQAPQPSATDDSGQEVLVCTLEKPYFPYLLLIGPDGTTVTPRIPRNRCGKPDRALQALFGPEAPLQEVAVTRVRQIRSEAEVASGCQGYKNMIEVEGQSPSGPASAGPAFPARPERLQVCVYTTPPDDPTSPEFVRGRWLTPQEIAELVDELGALAADDRSCRVPSREYAVLSGYGGWVLVELGGCHRVLRDDYSRGRLTAPSGFLASRI